MIDVSDRHLVLVGLMGSGKSTVGALLADRLGRHLVDSDVVIEAQTGRSVREIRDEFGTAAMRRQEAAALLDALDRPEPVVVAAAAGVVLDVEYRRRLRTAGAFVVWLDGTPDRLADRLAEGTHRPFVEHDPVGTLRAMHSERADLYRQVADSIVAVDGSTPDEIADEIVDEIADRIVP